MNKASKWKDHKRDYLIIFFLVKLVLAHALVFRHASTRSYYPDYFGVSKYPQSQTNGKKRTST